MSTTPEKTGTAPRTLSDADRKKISSALLRYRVLAYATGYVATRRSLPAGGAGLVEVMMTFALVWVGMPLAPALLGVITYRAFSFWLPVIPALAALPAVRRMRHDFRRGEKAFDSR